MTTMKQTKKDKLRALIARPEGASIDDLVKKLGWQKHTCRALIARARKDGPDIKLVGGRYQVVEAEAEGKECASRP